MRAILELLQLLVKEENIFKSFYLLLRGGSVFANLKKHGTFNTLVVLGILIFCTTLFFFLCEFLFKLLFKIKYINLIKNKIIDFAKSNKKILYAIAGLILLYFISYLFNNKELLPVVCTLIFIFAVSYYFYYSIKKGED